MKHIIFSQSFPFSQRSAENEEKSFEPNLNHYWKSRFNSHNSVSISWNLDIACASVSVGWSFSGVHDSFLFRFHLVFRNRCKHQISRYANCTNNHFSSLTRTIPVSLLQLALSTGQRKKNNNNNIETFSLVSLFLNFNIGLMSAYNNSYVVNW